MNKISLIIIGTLFLSWCVLFLLSEQPQKNENELPIIQSTPTIDYYKEDLYAQCRGLEYFNGMIKDNESLKIYENFQKEYQKTVDNIEADKKYLGLHDFECPESNIGE